KRTSDRTFSALFFDTYRAANPGKRLAPLFATASTRDRISINDSDEAVIDVVEAEVESAIDRSLTILKNRIDQFGTTQPNIQKLPGTGRIQIEVPGADNPQRIRKLLQGVARLEFWDVIEPYTLNNQLMAINELLMREQKLSAPEQAKSEPDLSQMLAPETDSQDTTASELEKQLQASTDSAQQGLDSLQNVSSLFRLNRGQGTFAYSLTDTATVNAIFRKPEVKSILRGVGVHWANKVDKNGTIELFFLDKGPSGK